MLTGRPSQLIFKEQTGRVRREEPPDAQRPFIPLAADATGCDAGAKACSLGFLERMESFYFFGLQRSQKSIKTTQ